MKILFIKTKISWLLLLFFGLLSFSSLQAQVPFNPRLVNETDPSLRYINIRGDYTFLSNGVMNRVDWVVNANNANEPYNGNLGNNNWHREYIDIDGDPTTFSSSSSTLEFDDPDCTRIYYAGLYWAGNYDVERRSNFVYPSEPRNDLSRNDFTQIKFKVPGGTYIDIQADTAADPVGQEDDILVNGFATGVTDSPYVCYKNVTSELQALADPRGEYTVANVRGTRGFTTYGAAGWTLVVIYENPNLPGRYISTFDGYEGVTTRTTASATADINVNGFNTIPVGPVNARLGVSVLEGENDLTGDNFRIRSNSNSSFTRLENPLNPRDNFFNSNITIDGAHVTTRNIASQNTLGYDSDIFDINNPANSIIGNGETGATLRLNTQGDFFGAFLVAFGVEIIEPNIVLEKRVEDIAGNDITDQGVNLGQMLDYVLSFQNIGNDDAATYTIRDVFPINTTFIPANLVVPPGVTYTFDAVTNEITFTIPPSLVEENDPISTIRMRVRVAENCFDFIDACTNTIQNLAFGTYTGVINDNEITDDPSVTDFDDCGFVTAGATNFLLDDLANCDFSRTVLLCGDNVLLDAGDGFDDYIWYRDINLNGVVDPTDPVINDGNPDGDASTQMVDQAGIYIVDKLVADPCIGYEEIITVELFGATQSNPIVALINDTTNTVEGQILTCPNDGSDMPEIFLCGLNDTELIEINIPDAVSIIWEQLDETSCAAATTNCPNTDTGCTWNQVSVGNSYEASAAGQYRVVINYANGCFSRFSFNVFQNLLDPQFNSTDIICTTPGNITVTNVPANYDFQLLDATNGNILVPYSANNGPSFTINTNGAYTVELRQQGVIDGCVFRLEDIGIRTRDFQVEVTPRNTDCTGLGEISISALNVEPQYMYQISQGGSVVDTFGPSGDNNYTFENLNPGIYDILLTTDDGCSYTEQVTIEDNNDLEATAVTTKPIDCNDGIITVTGTGGFPNPDYVYAIWSFNGTDLYTDLTDIPAGQFQVSNDFVFDNTQAGDYEFIVVDGNNCFYVTNVATIGIAPNAVYTPIVTDENCFGANDGAYNVNVTNSFGYTLSYVLTYPDTTTATNTSGVFTSLPQGDYSLEITQVNGTSTCLFTETFTIGGPTSGLSADALLTQDYTCLQNATIQAQNIVGGTAPYAYSIDGINFVNGAGAETFTNLTDGTFMIVVRDANGCTFTTNAIVVDPLNEPTDLSFTATAPNCPAETSNVTVTVTDGNTPFVFEIVSPVSIAATTTTGSIATFDGLAPDTYTFRATDDKGCTIEETFTITPVTPINVVGQLVRNISCINDTDGEALFTISGFDTDYDYSITGPATFNGTSQTNTTIPLNGLDDGIYTITVTDNTTSCTANATVTIEAPTAALTLGVTATQPTCTTDGSVQLNAAGGWGGNTFTITYPDGTTTANNTTGDFTGLTQTGTYNASVADANGCTVTTTFDLNPAVAPVLEIVPNAVCYTAVAGLSLTANVISGGDGSYEYSLNGGPFVTTNTFSGLAPGTYTIDVRDGNNCTDSASITVNPELTLTATADNISSCGTTTDVSITGAGGDGNYVYALVPNGTTPNIGDFGGANTITANATGDFDVYIRDNNGNAGFCEAQFPITIAQDAPLALNIANTPILCSGQAQANITIAASGGEAPFEYSIDNGTTYQTSNTFVNRAAGSYTIRVRDANNCEVSEIHTITEPFTLSASAGVTEVVECNPADGAEVRITNVLGGTAPYEYSFDGGATYGVSNIAFLLSGTHSLFLRDANGCTFPMTVIVPDPVIAPTFTPTITYECDGDGVVTIASSNTTDFDYTYELNGVLNTPNNSNIFTNVPVGPQTLTINYIANTPPVPSDLLLEDFGVGANTSIAEIDPAYCYEPQDGSVRACDIGAPIRINDGEYSVTQVISQPFGSWENPNDHTGNVGGRYLAINVGGVAGVNGIIYAKRNIEVLANRDITISLEAFNLLRNGTGGGDPTIEIQLVNSGGTVIASVATGNIPKNTGPDDWHNYTVDLNPGVETNLDIVIRTNSAVTNGNDIAIDDIRAFQVPQVCSSSLDIPIVIEAGREFQASVTGFTDVSCNGLSDGTITFEVENFDVTTGFEYSVDGGTNYIVSTTSPVTTAAVFPAGTQTILIRRVADNGCSTTVTQLISEPTPVVTTASITDPFSCNNTGATITATATGGIPTYEYQLEDDLGNIITAYQTNDTFVVPAGNYIIRARDNNGCPDPIDTAITVANPVNPTFTTTATQCYSGNNDATIQVDVTSIPGNGGFQFQLDGGPWTAPTPATNTTFTFTGLGAGDHTIDVRDAFGCSAGTQTITINPQLELTASAANITACGTDIDVTITAVGGDGNHVFAIVADGVTPTAGDFSATSTQTVTGAGDYDVYVRDNGGVATFCEASFDLNIQQDAPIVITPTVTDVLCNGENTGAISLAIAGGNGPYEYQLEDNTTAILTAYQTSNTFSNLAAANNYVVRVRDTNGCDVTLPITINEPDAITAEAVITQQYSCTQLGEITVGSITPTAGGSGDYQYRINGGAWSASTTGGFVFTDLTDGNHIIEVRDANTITCSIALTPVTIDPLPIVPTLATTIAYNCDGTGNVTVTPFDATFTYIVDGVLPGQTGVGANILNNLSVGTHTITVDYGRGCTVDTAVVIENGNAFDATITAFDNINCNGLADGSITFDATNFAIATGFEYSVNGGSFTTSTVSPVNITGLTAQNYSIVIRDLRDPTNCSITLTQNLSEPTPVVTTASITDPFSCNNTGATITATATGGIPTYEYQLEDDLGNIITAYQANDTFVVTAGNYIIRARDNNGCPDPIDTAITVASPVSPTFTTTATQCYSGNNDATIQVDVTSVPGNGGFQFQLDGGPWTAPTLATATSFTFSGLGAGSYDIAVRDAFGCTAPVQTVVINPQLIAAVVLDNDLSCLVDASATITATGGSGTYTYEWSNDAGTNYFTTNFTANVFATNTAGTYIFRITDTTAPTACQVVTGPVTVSPADIPVITSVTPTDILCNGESTGTLDVVIDNTIGRPPYTINVLETLSSTNFGTQTTGLPAGDYEVTITDDKGCVSLPFPVSISQPNAIAYDINLVPITCDPFSGTNPGSITVENMAGGTAEFTYNLTGNNGFSDSYTTTAGGEDHTFAILDFGIYEVDVVDANGCSLRTTNIIASPPDDLDIDVSTATVDCTVGGTAVITVSSVVGSGNYEFAILETFAAPYSPAYIPADTPGGDTATFTGLTPGITYTFVVHDLTTDCYYLETAATPINSPSNLTASLDVVSNITCTGAADGDVTFTFDNYDAAATAVNYEIFNAQSNLTTGITGSSTVNTPGPTGAITITDLGPLPQGIYYVLLNEVGGAFNGCSVSTADITITESTNLLDVNATSPTNDNCTANAGVIAAVGQFGTAPYEYQYVLSTDPAPTAASVGWTSSATANVESGDYIVYIKDANDCIQNDPVTVLLDPSPEISLAVVDECVAEGNFEVLVTLTQSGLTPYSLSINGGAFQEVTFNGSFQFTVTGLNSGLGQTIAIRDLNGCGETQTFDIQPPLQFNATLTTLLDCQVAPANNAEITIDVISGSGNYEYEIDGPGAADEARTALPATPFIWTDASTAGTYTITVYDISTTVPNCFLTHTVDVPVAIVPNISIVDATDVTCNGADDGVIIVSATDNGLTPVSFEITAVNGTPLGTAIAPSSNTTVNATFTGLAGVTTGTTYTITATGSNGCTSTIDQVISQPDAIANVNAAVVEFACVTANNSENASITIDMTAITGGSGTYVRYEFINDQGTATTADDTIEQDGTNNVYIETNTAGGTYIINVYDNNGCIGSTTAAILPFIEISNPTVTITQDVTCAPGNDAEVQIGITQNPVAPVANMEYSVVGTDNAFSALNQTANTFTGIGVGNYLVSVENTDTGCVVQTTFTIADPNNFEITSVTTDAVCFGDNGTVTFAINDPVNPYTGGFTWQIYDTQGTATLADDAMIVGAMGVSANVGPTVPFAIAPGTYRVNIVQDSDPSCVNMDFFNIAAPPAAINAATDVDPITCLGNDGAIEIINTIGGRGGYLYYISTTPNPDPTNPANYTASVREENLSAGTYDIWVIDQGGCSFELTDVVLSDPTPITATLQITTPNCDGLDGVLEVTGTSGGQGSNYTYQLQRFDGASFVNLGASQTTTTFNGLGEGQYQVVINDQWSCTATTNAAILLDEIIPLATVIKTIDCTVTPGGEITITQTGGSGNFDYDVTFPDGTTTASNTTGVFTGLTQVGVYTFTVTDQTVGHVCAKTITQRLEAIVLPNISITNAMDVTCNAADDGSITVSATDNGITPVSFEITAVNGTPLGTAIAPTSNTDVNATFTGLAGTTIGTTYTITATGNNGCTSTIDQVISQPDAIANVNATVVEFACATGNNTDNASITIDMTAITGGSGNYIRYEFINDQGTVATADDIVEQDGTSSVYTETNTTGGTYIINVYDDNGCTGSTTATIVPFDALLTAAAAITNPISCNPGIDGEITITATSTVNDTSRFEYSIDNGATYQASNVFSALDIGTHNFLIRHRDTGCILTASETIADPNTFTIDLVKLQDVICFGTTTGQITLELVDATYPGGFDWEIFDTNGTPGNTADDVSVLTGTETVNGPSTAINLAAGSYIVSISQTNAPECVNTEAFTIAGPSAAITANTDLTPITCIGNDGAIEIIDVLGGYGGYSYFVGTAAPTGAGDYVANPLFDGLAVGTYQAWVIDSSGCEQLIQNNINLVDPTPITATLQINQENCTNLEGVIEVVGTAGGQGSNYTYQLQRFNGATFVDLGASQTTTVFNGLGEGVYQVVITDQWSCNAIIGTATLYEEINLTSTVVKNIDCTVTPDGEITITANGGSTNIEYTVTFPDGTTTATNTTGIFTGLSQAGTYSFLVRDLDTTNPVCEKTITQALDSPVAPILLNATISDVLCNGESNGSITAVLDATSATNPPYQYELVGVSVGAPNRALQNNPLFDGLPAGEYQVRVVSERGCVDTRNEIIAEPTALLIDATANAFVCATNNTVNVATITVAILDGATTPGVASGTGPYVYSLDNVNFQSSNTFDIIDNGTVQNFTVFVRDGNGCPTTDTVTIQPLNTFTAAVSQDTAITCVGPEMITITVSDNGNVGNTYTYELLPIGNPDGALTATPTNTTATFNLTAVGNYTFRITDTTTGCFVDTLPYEIAPFDELEVTASQVSSVTCFGDTNGVVSISIAGYTGGYSYEVFNQDGTTAGVTGTGNTSTNPLNITGLSGGNFFVRIVETDIASTLCTDDSNVFTIDSPDVPLTATIQDVANVTCTNDQGEILVDPEGGYAPYDIVLTNTTTTQAYTATDVANMVFTGLSEGSFTIVITDNNGCVFNGTENLVAPTPITADIAASITTLVCFGDSNATVTAQNVLGGEGVYQYQINHYDTAGTTIIFTSGVQTNPVFTGLGAGIYSISVSDRFNCDMETIQVTIAEPTEVASSLVQLSQLTCAVDAQIQLTATGGTAPYQYSVDNTTFLPMSGGDTHTFTVTDGVYQYYVIDANGCDANISNQVSIDAVAPLTIAIDDSAAIVNCTGEATATIIADATGGLGNYTYDLLDAPASTTPLATNTNGIFSNLIAGDYYVRVTSLDCEEITSVISISDPAPLQIDNEIFTPNTCPGSNDGSITVEVSGGTGTILYAISPNLNQFDTESTFTNLAPGIYDVIAQDENGCFLTFQYTITDPAPIVVDFTVLPEICAGNEDGSVALNITGGTAPYSTSLNSNADADFVQDRLNYSNLAAGTYVVFVRDAAGCNTNIIVEVDGGVNLNATIETQYECSGDTPTNSINIVLEDQAVSGDVLYALDSTDPTAMVLTPDFSNMTPGTHYITIAHSNGCMNRVDFEIEDFAPLTLTVELSNINELTATADGGRSNYTFYFGDEDNGTDNTFIINRTDTYTVRVVDENGCEAVAQIFAEFIDIEIPDFFTPDGDGSNDFFTPRNRDAFPQIITIIFDRYGREIYRFGLNDSGWDGRYKGTDLPTGDYWYTIKLNGAEDKREFIGNFTLYR